MHVLVFYVYTVDWWSLGLSFCLFSLTHWVRGLIGMKLGICMPPHYPCWLLVRILENSLHMTSFTTCLYPKAEIFLQVLPMTSALGLVTSALSSVLCLHFPSLPPDLKVPQNLGQYLNTSLSWLPTTWLIQSLNQTFVLPQISSGSVHLIGGSPDCPIQDCSTHHYRHLLVLLCIASWDVSSPLISDIYMLIFPCPLLQGLWEGGICSVYCWISSLGQCLKCNRGPIHILWKK